MPRADAVRKADTPAPSTAPASAGQPSLLGRIKAGLKSLVKRSPPAGH